MKRITEVELSDGSVIECSYFELGMTVSQLKEVVNKWPEIDMYGKQSVVRITTEIGVSHLVKYANPLNFTNGTVHLLLEADILDD